MANLVIVESPAKASTIKGYLGSNYKVVASKGHVRDLPKSSLGVDIEHDFEPHYINIRGKGDLIGELKKEAKAAGKVFLATDPDREGEAISWHLASALGIPEDSTCRVTFNEITKNAIKDAIKKPRKIDINLVNAQQTRRILDRIVGYQISPFLWKNIKGRLSAGRVQSVATRIIAEREEEIRNFVPVEYYTITLTLSTENGEVFAVKYFDRDEKKYRVISKEKAMEIHDVVKSGPLLVSSVKNIQKIKSPAPPFTTSTMQQEASKRLGFQSYKIMKIAQELYEGIFIGTDGIQGLITYMRTDSLRISDVAQSAALSYIKSEYGDSFVPNVPRKYKAKQGAQDAHEAIRPSNIKYSPDKVKKYLTADQYKLYKLVWDRFIASQMSSAVIDSTAVEVECHSHLFRAYCDKVKFAGYMALYDNSSDTENDDGNLSVLPTLIEGEKLNLKKTVSEQHFTEPPARYTEASLIKFLEENGIGRPSTYTPIITTIIARDYVRFEGRSLVTTPLGEMTNKIMTESFPEIVDYEFTASMENKLDEIESGNATMKDVLTDFYKDFREELESAEKNVSHVESAKLVEESEYKCDKCGSPMVYKNGRFGRFLACSNYPNCRNTMAIDKNGKPQEKKKEELTLADFKCEKCGSDVYIRHGKYGDFYSCSNYPTCKFTKPVTKDTGVACPKCGAKIVARVGRSSDLYTCERYPDCDFSSWDMPTNKKCPDCGSMLFYKKTRKALVCKNKGCQYTEPYEPDDNN